MFDKLLPIGSVVLLKGGTKKLMIIGIKPISEEDPDRVYDYMGVIYPEGFLSDEYNFMFDHENINDVIFLGYNNPEREAFIEFIKEAYEKKKLSEIE